MDRLGAIVFDVGNVLHFYDPKPIHQDIISFLGISQEEFIKIWNPLTIQLELGVITEDDYWNSFKSQVNSYSTLPSESLLIRKYSEGFKINYEVLEIVKSLKSQGLDLSILSNSIAPHYEFNKKAGLYDNFPILVFSHQVGLRKPDLRIYYLTINRLNIDPKQSLFIDDREENVSAALEIGMNGHVFQNATILESELKNYGIKV